MISIFGNNSEKILLDLQSSNEKLQKNAKEKLNNLKFAKNDLPLIYQAIKHQYKDDNDKFLSTKNSLLNILWKINDNTTPDFINEIYNELPDNIDIKFSALRTLSEINTEKSNKIFVNLLLKYKPDLKYNIYTLFVPYYNNGTKFSRILFPSLFSLLDEKTYKIDIYILSLDLKNKGLLKKNIFDNYKIKIITDFNDYLILREKTDSKTDDYNDINRLLEILADVMSFFPNDNEIINLLNKSLNDNNIRIVLFAALSLIKNNKNVDTTVLEKIASNPETRLDLYDFLQNDNKINLFPKKYNTQKFFAESDMVRWLCFPTEFGKAPDEIKIIDIKEINNGVNKGRYYLFKYLYKDDENGWLVGLSGPHSLNENEIYASISKTFSHFYKFSEKTINEHYDSFLK